MKAGKTWGPLGEGSKTSFGYICASTDEILMASRGGLAKVNCANQDQEVEGVKCVKGMKGVEDVEDEGLWGVEDVEDVGEAVQVVSSMNCMRK